MKYIQIILKFYKLFHFFSFNLIYKCFKYNKLKFMYIFLLIYFCFIHLKNKNIIKDKISIIIPTYNRERLINRSLYSVLNQTYKNIEIIVIDDCSTDNTQKVVHNIKTKRIRYIKLEKKKGAAYARNLGIKISKGKYIAFQDSDDVYYYNKLERQIQNLRINKSNFDFCKINIYINNTYNYTIPSNKREKNIIKGEIINELCKGNFISTQSILVEKNIIKQYLFDNNLPRFQDYDLVLRMIPKVKVSYTNEVLADLHLQNDSIGSSIENLKNAVKILYNKNYALNHTQNTTFLKYLNKILKKYS